MGSALAETGMAKKSLPLRIEEETLQLVRIAAAMTGEQATEYATRVLAEHARADIERLHDKVLKPKPKSGKESKN